ncbi:MAG: DMT family transporter [Oceanospirillaceae bacterium]|nr:DMT family transporter [Oceanospirillaceae bacterium]
MSFTLFKSNNAIGIICAIGASLCFSATDVTIKFLSDAYALHQIILLRSLIGVLVIILLVVTGQGSWRSFKTQRLPMHLIRGGFVVMANMLFFLGLAAMPLADAVALFFISPSLVTLFSIIFLKEQVGPHRWFAIALGFAGVLVMVQPGSNSFVSASLLPISAAFGYAALHTLTRTMRATESASTMTFYIQLTFIFVSTSMWVIVGDGSYNQPDNPSLNFLLRQWAPWQTPDLKLFVMLGVASTFGGYLISQAYRIAEAALAAPFEYTALPLAMIWGVVIFGQWPSHITLIGSSLILASGLYTLYRELLHRPKQQQDAPHL